MSGRVRILLLAGILAIVGGWYVTQRVLPQAGPAVATGAPTATGASAPAGADGVEDLQLEALGPSGDVDATPERNPFRFERRRIEAAGPPPTSVRQPDVTRTPAAPGAPLPPAGPPPIPLRYIGFLDEMGDKPRIAVLSDGRGSVFNGREGDIIDGRYRLERIGTESAELAYLDGRGRQTLRLSGQ